MWWLISLAIANSILSVYYYLLVLRQAFVTPETEEEARRPRFRLPLHATASLTVLAALVLWIGVYPALFVEAAEAGARTLFGG